MKSVLLATAAGWLARILAILVNLVGMPLVLEQLGSTRFGIMLIAMSIGSWVGIGNIGLGRVVANIVARFMHKSTSFLTRVISYATLAAFSIQTVFFCVCVATLLIFARFIDLGSGGSAYEREFVASTIGIFFTFSLWFSLSVFEGIDAGQHRLFRLSFYQIIAYVLTLVLLFTVFKRAPTLLLGTLLLSSGFVIGNLMHAIDIILRNRRLFTWGGGHRRALMKAMVFNSVDFTVISLAVSVIFQFSTGLFGLIVGPDAIVNLGVFMKIMSSVAGIILTVAYPMSNLIAGRLAKGDVTGAVDAALLTGGGLLTGCALAAIGFELYGEQVVSIWLRIPTVYEPLFKSMAATLIFAAAVYQYATSLAVGFGNLRSVARIHAAQGIVVLPAAWICYRLVGQAGILLAMNLVLFAGAVACLATGSKLGYLRQRLGF